MDEHTDLQRLAAQAMGYRVSVKRAEGGLFVTSPARRIPFKWTPEHDDGDSRRMQAALGISVEYHPIHGMPKRSVVTQQRRQGDLLRQHNPTKFAVPCGDDPAAATRLACLQTAAAIARNPQTS